MTDLLVKFALNHQDYFYGLATGYAVAHIPQLVVLCFQQAMRVPWLRAAIVNNPERSKAIIRQIEQELEKDIDAEVASEPPKPA